MKQHCYFLVNPGVRYSLSKRSYEKKTEMYYDTCFQVEALTKLVAYGREVWLSPTDTWCNQ